MANSAKKSNRTSFFYILALLVSVAVLAYVVVTGTVTDNARLIFGMAVFLVLLAMAYYSVVDTFLAIIAALPVLIGIDSYQINIGAFAGREDLYVNSFSLACGFVVFLAATELFKRGLFIIHIPLSFIITAAVVLNAISFLGSDNKLTGIVFELYFLAGFAAYFLGYVLLNSVEKYVKTIFVVIFSAVIPAALGVVQLLGGKFLFEADSSLGRIQGSFPHSNTFGSFLFVVLTLYFIAYIAIRKKRSAGARTRNKLMTAVIGIPFLTLLGLLVLTFSRTAWIGFSLAVAAVAILRPRLRPLVAYAGSLAFFVGMLIKKVRERVTGVFDRYMFDSLYGRFDIWDTALFEARKKPLAGFGMGSFENVIKDARGKETGNVYPHNDGIRFLLEGGVLGLMGYLLYMAGAIFYAARSYIRHSRGNVSVTLWSRALTVDLKLLGIIPLLLFAIMVPISFVEAPSMDFIYQIFSWMLLGSWLGLSDSKTRIKTQK